MRNFLRNCTLLLFMACAIGISITSFASGEILTGTLCALLIPGIVWMMLASKYDANYISHDVLGPAYFGPVTKYHFRLANTIETDAGIVDLRKTHSVTPAQYLWRWTIYHDPETGIRLYHDNASGLAVNGWYYST